MFHDKKGVNLYQILLFYITPSTAKFFCAQSSHLTCRFSLSHTKSCYVKQNYSIFCGLCGTTMPPHHTHEVMNPIDPPGLPKGVPRFHLHYIKLTFLRQEGFCLFLHISYKTSYYLKLKQKKNLPEGVSQNMSQNKAKIFAF